MEIKLVLLGRLALRDLILAQIPFVWLRLAMTTKEQQLDALQQEHVRACPHCVPRLKLGEAREVFGEGDPDAELMFIGEGPGAEEDRLGRPFVGAAGKLLDKQITAMGLKRDEVYIANVVKTRPPDNRIPTPDEARACKSFLEEQIRIIKPKVIVALGATATKYLFDDLKLSIMKQRGNWHEYHGTAVMPTLHPAYLLRQYNRDAHRLVWEDLQLVLARLGRPVPSSSTSQS